MADIYQTFLRKPQASLLADNATLHYITTTTSINGAEAILKHLQAQRTQLTKTDETVLSCIEGVNAVSMEISTKFKILQSGGVYLPKLESHLITDMEPCCPMLHFVQFDHNRRISQIRVHWDQATLLKQVEAIGKSGRNWPIQDGKDQVDLISKCISQQPAPIPKPAQSQRDSEPVADGKVFRQGPPKHDYQTRLFDTSEEQPYRVAPPADAVQPRESARPQDHYNDLFPDGSYKEDRHDRPSNTKRYDHFEFGDADSPQAQRQISQKAADKQTSHWNHGDHETPHKNAPRYDPEHERHFGHDIDEPQKTPYHVPVVHRPRPDAQNHFSIDSQSPSDQKLPLRDNSNVSNARRNDEMSSHFAGSSPAAENQPIQQPKIYKTAGDGLGGRAGARTWNIFGGEDDEGAAGEKEKRTHVYKTYGNGMGGRRDGGASWNIGD